MTRSTDPKLVVFQPTRTTHGSVDPVFRTYTPGSGQVFYPDPRD
jgi:hypothetical protein